MQQDGTAASARSPYCGSVSEFLNEEFPDRWIVRGTAAPPSPMSWCPRIPDLTTPDYSLWG